MDGKALLQVPAGHPSMILVLQRVRVGEGQAAKVNDFANLRTTQVGTALDALYFADVVKRLYQEPSIELGLEELISEKERTPGNGILVAVLDPTWARVVRFAGSRMFERVGLALLALQDQAEQWRIRTALEVSVPGLVVAGMLDVAKLRSQMGKGVLVAESQLRGGKR